MSWSRRRLVQAMLGGALLAPLAGASPPERLLPLSAAFRAAVDHGKPMLVIVIPKLDDERWRRGEALAELFAGASPSTMDRLAATELVAATMGDLRTLVPSAPADEPLLVLVDPSSLPARCTAVRHPLPTVEDATGGPWEDGWQAEKARFDREQQARVQELEASVLAALPATTGDGVALVAALAAKPIPGSRWYLKAGPCGMGHVEGQEVAMVRCGMGHVSARIGRVLHLFPS